MQDQRKLRDRRKSRQTDRRRRKDYSRHATITKPQSKKTIRRQPQPGLATITNKRDIKSIVTGPGDYNEILNFFEI